MKKEPKAVYILSEVGYMKITYAELNAMREADKAYSDKHFFIPIQGMLIELSKNDYTEMYQTSEHNIYLKKLDKKFGLLSIDAFDNEDDNGTDYVCDRTVDVEKNVIQGLMLEKLHICLPHLSADEQKLIHAIYYDQLSERDYSAKAGIPQRTINDRKRRILAKLKKLLEN